MPDYLSSLPIILQHLAIGFIYGLIFTLTCFVILTVRRKKRKLLKCGIILCSCLLFGFLCPVVGVLAITLCIILPLKNGKNDNTFEQTPQIEAVDDETKAVPENPYLSNTSNK